MRNNTKKEIRFIEKDIKLSDDFSRYASNHQSIFRNVPKNPCIIITDVRDKEFDAEKRSLSRRIKNCFVAEKSDGRWTLSPAH